MSMHLLTQNAHRRRDKLLTLKARFLRGNPSSFPFFFLSFDFHYFCSSKIKRKEREKKKLWNEMFWHYGQGTLHCGRGVPTQKN